MEPFLVTTLKRLGEARNGILVVVSLVYLLGFLSWASYAVANDIGFVALFDAQYLLGGIVPAATIAVAYSLWRLPRVLNLAAGAIMLLIVAQCAGKSLSV